MAVCNCSLAVGVMVGDTVEVIVIMVVLPSTVVNIHYMHTVTTGKPILPSGNVLTAMMVGGPS